VNLHVSQDDRDSPDGANLATCVVCLLRSRPATSETLRHRASCHTQSEESFMVAERRSPRAALAFGGDRVTTLKELRILAMDQSEARREVEISSRSLALCSTDS